MLYSQLSSRICVPSAVSLQPRTTTWTRLLLKTTLDKCYRLITYNFSVYGTDHLAPFLFPGCMIYSSNFSNEKSGKLLRALMHLPKAVLLKCSQYINLTSSSTNSIGEGLGLCGIPLSLRFKSLFLSV
jgi:hypothetical protein